MFFLSEYVDSIILPEAYFSSLAGYKAEIIGYGRTSPGLFSISTFQQLYIFINIYLTNYNLLVSSITVSRCCSICA